MRFTISLIARTLALTGAIVSLAASPASAAFFTVNTVADAPDASPGDGHCRASGPPSVRGLCTLRSAIDEANALGGADYITVPAGIYSLTFVPGKGRPGVRTLWVKDDLHLTGAGAALTIISAGGLSRVMDVGRLRPDRRPLLVQIEGLTLEGGNATDPLVGGESGGGLAIIGASVDLRDCVILKNRAIFGGGIAFVDGRLSLQRVTVAGNEANQGGGIVLGRGTLLVTDSVITQNKANQGGGIDSFLGTLTIRGGAIDGNTALVRGGGVLLKGNITEGSAQFESVRVSGNSAQDGGGIYADIAVFVLLASDVYENTATRNGGGIHFATRFDYPSDFVAGNWAQIEASSISKNVAGQDGGGLYNGMQLSVNNSTLSGNEAGNEGGGLFNIGGNVRFRYATVYSNAAALGGGFVNREGGRRTYGLVGGPVSLQNSIIAFNKAGSCVRIRSRLDGDFSPVTSLGYNLLDDTACPILSGIDLFEVDPMLGPLATNGATTLNHVPRFGSPAIDAIPIDGWSLLPTCRAGMDDDQRLVARPKGGGCDIGAVEFVGLIEPPQQ